jgi:sarcosine oxidase
MNADRYDVAIVGLGVMGTAAAWALSRRGLRVLGLEQFQPAHARGSSHGESRIIRELYFEHPLYVPILQRAYALWGEVEAESDTQLLYLVGGLTLGPATGRVVPGAREAARRFNLPLQELSPEVVARRFPAIRPPADYIGVWDARGGYVRADLAISAFRLVAERRGAALHYGVQVTGWRVSGDGVVIETGQGAYHAARLVLAVGPWAPRILSDLHLPLVVERQVLVWFDPPIPAAAPDLFDSKCFPIFVYEYRGGQTSYGFPRVAGRVKAAVFHGGPTVVDPDPVQPEPTDREIQAVRDALAPTFPALSAAPVRASAPCFFTNSPDSRFVIGPHPAAPQVLICSPCSGHGFKFAPAIGDIVAELITTGTSTTDLSPFEVTRFLHGP